MDAHRAVRPPPSRRALFHSTAHNPPAHPSTRRQNPTSVRPDTANIFTQPMEGELVERDQKGEYVMCSPQTTYKHLALGLSGGRNGVDEDTEHENAIIQLYGKPNPHLGAAEVEEEIRMALKSSLKKKVASLDEDKWMFQGDTHGPGKT